MNKMVIGMLFRNNRDLVFPLISLIKKSMTTPIPIIAFDDCSEDDTVSELLRVLNEDAGDIITISAGHVGISKGRNQILRDLNREYPDADLVLLDSDVIVAQKGFFDKLADLLHSDPRVGVVCPRLKSFYSDIPDNHGIACCVIKNEVMKKIGEFDERFYMFYDDSDYWKRTIEQGGYAVMNTGAIECIHIWGSTVTTGSEGTTKEAIHIADQLAYENKWKI